MKSKNINYHTIIKYLLVIIQLYFNQTSVLMSVKFAANSSLIMGFVFVICAMIFLYAFVFLKKQLSYQAIIIAFLLMVNLMISMFVNSDFRLGYLLIFMNIIGALMFTSLFTKEEFYEIYVNCLVVISALTIVMTYLILPVSSNHFKILSNAGATYYDAFVVMPYIFPFAIQRANAIWFEPGMFAIYLSFAIAFEMLLKHKATNYIKVGILTVAMLATLSNTGYVILFLLYLMFFLQRTGMNIETIKKTIVFGVLSVVVIYVGMLFSPGQLQELLYKFNPKSLNFIGRLAPGIFNIEQGLKAPLFGQGFHEGFFRVNYSFYKGVLFCNTSTTTQFFYYFGILFPVFTAYCSWKIANAGTSGKKIVNLFIMAILILCVNFESLVLDQIYMILLFSAFMDDRHPARHSAVADKNICTPVDSACSHSIL